MINKLVGNRFEQDLCETLADAGWWAHNMANRKNGQPADIIAVVNNRPYLIDAKVCGMEVFAFRRVEDNQHMAMTLWMEAGNTTPWFALRARGEVYMVSYLQIRELQAKGRKQINLEEMAKYGTRLATWIRQRGR